MSSRALVGSTKYVVVSHSVTSCSAVLNTNVNRVLHVCTGDGRSIVGGSVSIPNTSTVSVNTTVDEHGGAQVAGSTVTVEGGTTALSGNVQLSGTLKPVGGLVLANGTTVSGVGAGAVVDWSTSIVTHVPNIRFTNIRITDSCIVGCTDLYLENCYVSNSISRSGRMATVLERNNNLTCINCILEGINNSIIHSDDSYSYLKKCTFIGSTLLVGGAPTKFEDCTFNQSSQIGMTVRYLWFLNNKDIRGYIASAASASQASDCTFVFDGSNKLSSYIAYNSSKPTNIVIITSGSTLSLYGNTTQHIFQNCRLVVGTITQNVQRPVLAEVAGTAKIITTSGSTITVSGEGTYLDNDGTTDLMIGS